MVVWDFLVCFGGVNLVVGGGECFVAEFGGDGVKT